jgi:hypothetical protein
MSCLPQPKRLSLPALCAPDEAAQRLRSIVSEFATRRRPLVGTISGSRVHVWLRVRFFGSPVEFVGVIRPSARGAELAGELRLGLLPRLLHTLAPLLVLGWAVTPPYVASTFIVLPLVAMAVASSNVMLRTRFASQGNRLALHLSRGLQLPATQPGIEADRAPLTGSH